MTETEIILLMVKGVPILLAVWIFMHLLSEEYLRALEFRGLIPPRRSKPVPTEKTDEGDDKTG